MPMNVFAGEVLDCSARLEMFAENGIDVEPVYNETDCLFEPRQCNEIQCWCVKPRTGELQESISFPPSEEYDCTCE